jgi:hypothetical protein
MLEHQCAPFLRVALLELHPVDTAVPFLSTGEVLPLHFPELGIHVDSAPGAHVEECHDGVTFFRHTDAIFIFHDFLFAIVSHEGLAAKQ